MNKVFAGIALLVAAGIGVGGYAWLNQPNDQFADCRTSQVAGIGKIGGPFSLIDQDGQIRTDKDVIDGLTLVYFGYTYCPDVCPLDMARNSEVATKLHERGIPLRSVMISIDPERDTPAALRDFAEYNAADMVGLTGTLDQITAVAKTYGVYFAKNAEGEDYLMDHTAQSYLMHPTHGFLDFFPREIRAEQMTDTIACFAGKL